MSTPETLQHFIGGKRVDGTSGRFNDVYNPALGVVKARVPLATAEAMLEGPVEIAVVGRPGPERDALARVARRRPGAVVLVAEPGRDDVPLLEGRVEVDGRPAAYVCRNLVCERPVTDPADLPR